MNKRILFIDHDAGRSGSTTSLEYLIRAFQDREYDVSIHTPKKGSDAASLERKGVRIFGYGRWPFHSLAIGSLFLNTEFPLSARGLRTNAKDFVKFFAGILMIRGTIRCCNPDLVYVNEPAIIQGSIAALLCGVPSVIHVRSLLLKGVFGIRRRTISFLVRKCNQRIFAITRKEAAQLEPNSLDLNKISIVREFFSFDNCHPASSRRPSNEFALLRGLKVVAMLGGIQSIKGTLDFLQAAASILSERSDVQFVVAGATRANGAGKERQHYSECMEIVREHSIDKRVVVLGEIRNSLELIELSDIVVSPSTVTHFSRPVIEAWGFGKPVIVSATEHMIELVNDGVDGLLVNVGDRDQLASKIEMLLDDETLRHRLGEAGKERMKTEFSAEANTRKIIECCEILISSKT